MLRARIATLVLLFTGTIGVLIVFPGIDLATSRLFYVPGIGFSQSAVLAAVHYEIRYLVGAIAFLSATLLVWPRRRRAAIFLLASLALGPGLLVNTIFKDNWGRARPSQIVEFGGTKALTPAFVPTDQCVTNCSFPAGDPAVGFFLVSGALLIESAALRRWAVAGALVIGSALGFVRIAQGAHFLSDVVTSGFLVTGLSWMLHRVIVARDPPGASIQGLQKPSPTVAILAVLTVATAVAGLAGFEWLDRPIAFAVHDALVPLQPAVRFITAFGLGGPYLILTALAAVSLRIAGYNPAAWRSGYIFLAVAGSGLLVDIIKLLAGRARPKLWFADHAYGFTGPSLHATYWSFPSGHSVTAGALAFALSITVPRLRPAWIVGALMIGTSRVLLDAHYLSDVIVGFYVGVLTAWAIAVFLRARGISLAPQ
ncbi:MAG: phosphatase PAP2 family protein [Alphaproteobacteria bacterium]|nr:phosphatase PAP2 family protein [Alphaproteobacteria bacterium]